MASMCSRDAFRRLDDTAGTIRDDPNLEDFNMQVALLGLTQSGKTTLFSAVTEGHTRAAAAMAHQADQAVVKVPDERLNVLAQMHHPKKITQATLNLLDLPGLSFVDEAARHDARRLMAQARQADMLVLVLRAFHDPSIAPYRNRVDPAKDLEELHNEMLLGDLEMIENRIDKLKKSITKPTPHIDQDKRELALMQRLSQAAENLEPLRERIESPEEEKLCRSFGFLTLKPVLPVLNVDEDSLKDPPLIEPAASDAAPLPLATKLEAELVALEPDEREAFMQDLDLSELARDKFLQQCYRSVNLISYFTAGEPEVRAWTVPAGSSALEAAGAIHSDIQRGFIRAETVAYDDLMAAGDMKAAKAAGKVRLEGKTYTVKDGDVIYFRFSV